jgi:hypothetical protein
MRLPQQTLLQPFQHLDNPPSDIPHVAIACSRCKTAGTYSEADLEDSAEAEIVPSWEVVEWLRCVEEICRTPLVLFAEWSATTTETAKALDRAVFRQTSGLQCAYGHQVKLPQDWRIP